MIIVAMVSVNAREVRAQESWPRVELSAGTWISVGDTRWAHNASSNPGLGNPTSKLTYKDVGTNVIDLTGKLWFTPRVFGRLNGGFAGIGGGRLTDDDFGSGQRLFSKTISNVPDNNMYYINSESPRLARPVRRISILAYGASGCWYWTGRVRPRGYPRAFV
jgi:hypothetical protein